MKQKMISIAQGNFNNYVAHPVVNSSILVICGVAVMVVVRKLAKRMEEKELQEYVRSPMY